MEKRQQDEEEGKERQTLNEASNGDEISNFLPETLKRGNIIVEPTWRDTLKQVIASCMMHCIVIQAGVNMAYSTVLTRGLRDQSDNYNVTQNNNTEGIIVIDDYHASWIASLVTITLPIGSLIAGPLMDRFGRKWLSIAQCVPTILSWLLIYLSNSLRMIYVGRSIAGVSAGLTSVGLMYVIETTNPRVRGMLLCLNSVFVSLGILLTCMLAVWLTWREMAILFLLLEILIFSALFTLPESPYWLLCFGRKSEDRIAKAQRSIRWFNPRPVMYEQEYMRIKETERRMKEDEWATRESSSSGGGGKLILGRCKYYRMELVRPAVYKPLILLAIILVIQQFSGAYVVIFYAILVFEEIGGSFGRDLDEYGALLLLGIIRFIMSILTAYLSRTIGRRLLCIASGLGMAFSMFFSGMLIYLSSAVGDSEPITDLLSQQKWLLLVVVLFYVCMSTLGFIVIPWTLIGELLPISFRGIGGGIMISFAYIVMFVVIKSYPFALKALGAQNVFFFFSLVCLLGTCFVYLFLPETLGKSLKEIEDYFHNNQLNHSQEVADNNAAIRAQSLIIADHNNKLSA